MNADPHSIQSLFDLALRHHEADQLAEAERLYRQILAKDANHADAYHLMGVIALQVGQSNVAIDLIRRAIDLNGKVEHYHANLAIALTNSGRSEDALQAYSAAIRLKPDYAEAHFAMGNILREKNRLEFARGAFGAAIHFKPDYADAYLNLGVVLKDLDRLEDAVRAYRGAILLKPDSAAAYTNLGLALKDQEHVALAITACRAAIHLEPDLAEAHSNLGLALQEGRRFEEAGTQYRRTLCLNPGLDKVLYNLGGNRTKVGRFEESSTLFRRACSVNPDYVDAHLYAAIGYLFRGDYLRAWPEYEWRWRTGDKVFAPRDISAPLWRGEDVTGRTVLLHTEQGMGDNILACRFAPLVSQRGARVIMAVPRSMMRLLSGVAGVDEWVAAGDAVPDVDLHCPMLSLPNAFNTTLETIPSSVPYLRAEPAATARWAERLGRKGFRIGITWQGATDSSAERGRSVPLSQFAPLARIPGVRLVSLQKGAGTEQLEHLPPGMVVESLGADFDAGPDAFIDTAAVMMTLDLVITVDTAIGHLAGALGRPVWIALQKQHYWLWMHDRADSPWYPTARLFRQTEQGDWASVFAQIAERLTVEGLVPAAGIEPATP